MKSIEEIEEKVADVVAKIRKSRARNPLCVLCGLAFGFSFISCVISFCFGTAQTFIWFWQSLGR